MKILKNKRGFSLVELMVVVAIMGVLSAIAIPSYLTYQENAREGVVQSMLHLVDRTVAIETSLGNSLTTIKGAVVTSIWGKIQSNDKAGFDDPIMTANDDQWCVSISGKSTDDDYKTYSACVSNNRAAPAKKVAVSKSCSSYTVTGDCTTAGCTWTAGTTTCSGTATAVKCTGAFVCGV